MPKKKLHQTDSLQIWIAHLYERNPLILRLYHDKLFTLIFQSVVFNCASFIHGLSTNSRAFALTFVVAHIRTDTHATHIRAPNYAYVHAHAYAHPHANANVYTYARNCTHKHTHCFLHVFTIVCRMLVTPSENTSCWVATLHLIHSRYCWGLNRHQVAALSGVSTELV